MHPTFISAPGAAGRAVRKAGAWSDPVKLAVICIVLATAVLFFHAASESATAELGSHPDEAAHFVTGLMVHDYLASGFHESPLRYAAEYYKHYPKIGLGVWPPFFYLVQAAWTLVLPVGVHSILWLMAGLTLALGAVTAWALLKEYGFAQALTGSLLLISLPLIQQYSNMVMAEMLSALTMFCAVLSLARFLDSGRTATAVAFGICASLAILTKGTGLALAIAPPLAILFTGRTALLKNWRLWAAALIVVVIAGPWTWVFRNQGRGGWEEPSPSWHFTQAAIGFYGRQLLVATGWLLGLLAGCGVVGLFRNARKSSLEAASLALVLSVWSFQCIAPVGLEARHMAPAMACLMVLAMGGMRQLTGMRRQLEPAVCGVLLILFYAVPSLSPQSARAVGYGSLGSDVRLSPFRIPRKEWRGFEPLAEAALAGRCRHFLVASDARGEGMFIADMAQRDAHRPSYLIERASKIMASSTWSGGGYQAFYSTPAQVTDMLAKSGIEAVVIDTSLVHTPPHEALLESAMALSGSGAWREVKYPMDRDGAFSADALELFLPG